MPGRVDLVAAWCRSPKKRRRATGTIRSICAACERDGGAGAAIAAEIRRLIDSGAQIPDRDAPGVRGGAREGDFLVLVQRRSALFAETIRACKAAGLAVAGADRLKLGAELAVRDVTALLAFLATPEDDLVAGRSANARRCSAGPKPQLYALAQPRIGYLWEALRGDSAPCRNTGRSARPARCRRFSAALRVDRTAVDAPRRTRRGCWRDLAPRPRTESTSLLSQALAFEASEVPSLTGFLGWLAADDVDVKRARARLGGRYG